MDSVYALYIANKNYSSWSLRPWVMMRELRLPFTERLLAFGDEPRWQEYRRLVPSGKVPGLTDGDTVVWDSLSIIEYLGERHAGVWPAGGVARAWARSAAAEMHSGFSELRNRCSMSCGIRVRLREFPAALERDIGRLGALWSEGLRRFGGPFLAGDAFTAVDAFFAPVAFRAQTYGLTLGHLGDGYVSRLLQLESMRDWYAAALAETTRDLPHEAEIREAGMVTEDLRGR
jgi:glutathione S-transferase